MPDDRLKKPALCRDFRPSLGGYVTWLAVPPRWSEERAREAFRERYGREARQVEKPSSRRVQRGPRWPVSGPGCLLVGPVFVDKVPARRCSFHE